MKKRIISLFLCIVMLAGVLPTGSFTVFAEGEEHGLIPITELDVRYVTLPVEDKPTSIDPTRLGIISDPEFVSSVTNAYWYNATDNTASDKYFKEGKQYYLTVEITPNNGFCFEWDDTWQKNYTGKATILGKDVEVAWAASSEDGRVLLLRSQLYTPSKYVAPDVIPHPVVSEDEKVVVLSDGTKLFYDEKIVIKRVSDEMELIYDERAGYSYYQYIEYTDADMYEQLRGLSETLDKDKVYYVVVPGIYYDEPLNEKEITFDGVNVILDMHTGLRRFGKTVDRTLFHINDCGLFAMICSDESSFYCSNNYMSNYQNGRGTLLDAKNSNLIFDGPIIAHNGLGGDWYRDNDCLTAENCSIKILNGEFTGDTCVYAKNCSDVTIVDGKFKSLNGTWSSAIVLYNTPEENLHIYGGTFYRNYNLGDEAARFIAEAISDLDEYAIFYPVPEGKIAVHYSYDDNGDINYYRLGTKIAASGIEQYIRISTLEDEIAAGRVKYNKETVTVSTSEEYEELFTKYQGSSFGCFNELKVIFLEDMVLPSRGFKLGVSYLKLTLDLNGHKISLEGEIYANDNMEVTVTDSGVQRGVHGVLDVSKADGQYGLFTGDGKYYIDEATIINTNPKVHPVLGYECWYCRVSINHLITSFNPFYGWWKRNDGSTERAYSKIFDVTGCTITVNGETYDLKEWAVSNGYAWYNESYDNLHFIETVEEADIQLGVEITRHPSIGADCTIGPDETGGRLIIADGFAPVLKANGVSDLSDVEWKYLAPGETGTPFPITDRTGTVIGNNCALAYQTEGGKYHYFLIVDGEVVDDIFVFFSPLKGLRLVSEISPEGVFLEKNGTTCAQLNAIYAGALLEGETMTSLTFRILNRVSTSAFNKEVTLYNGDQITFPQDFYVNYPKYEAIDGDTYRIQVTGVTSTGRTLEGGIVTIRADVPATSAAFEYDYHDYYDGAYHVSDPDAGIGSLRLKFTPENASSLPGGLFLECDTVSDGGDVVMWDGEKLVLTGVPGTTTVTAKSGNGTVSSEPITVVVPVTDVEVNGVVPPKYGSEMNTGYLYVPDDAPYTIRDAYWEYPADDGYVRVEAGSTPMLNKDYRLCVDLALKPGYQVPSVYEEGTGEYAYGAVYGNGVSCTVSAMNSLGLGVLDASASGNTNGTPYDLTDDFISVTYHYGYVFNENAAEIDTVYVEFEAPRDVQTYEQWYKSVKFSCAYADEVEWGLSVSSKNEMFEVLGWKFVGNMYYTLTFNGYLGDSSGAFRFADKVTFIVNGESYEKNSTLDGRYVFSPNLSILAVGDPGYKPVTKLSVQPVTLTLDGSVNLNDYYTVETEGKLSVFAHSYYFNYDAETGTLSATEAFKSFAGTNPEYINGFIYLEIGFDKNSDGEYNIRFRYNIPVRILSGSLPTARQYRVKLGDEDGYAYSFAPLVGDTICYLPVQIDGSLASKSTSTAGTPVYDPISGLYSLKTPDTSVSARNVVTVSYTPTEDFLLLTKLNAAGDKASIVFSPDYHWSERNSGNAGWLYSLDGMNWQDSATFENLPAGTQMTVYCKQGIFGDVYSATLTTAGDPVTPPAPLGSLSGTVTSYQDAKETVLIQLIKEGSTEAAYEASVTGNSTSYEIKGIEAGIYVMKVMKKNHVTREYTVVVLDTAVTQDAKICLLGDVNLDGKVNTRDWNSLRDHINGSAPITDTYALKCSDAYPSNGSINTRDWNNLRDHINGSKPLW